MAERENHAWTEALARWESLAGAERRVADFVLQNPDRVVFMNALDIAEETGTSDATVVRATRSLGFAGLADLRHQAGTLVMRDVAPDRRLSWRLESVDDRTTPELELVSADLVDRIGEVLRVNGPERIAAATAMLDASKKVITYGVGLSKISADYAATRLRRLGVDAVHVRSAGFDLADDLLALRGTETAFVFVPGRLLPEVTMLMEQVAERGKIIVVTDTVPIVESDRLLRLSSPLSPGGLSGEMIMSLLLIDALVLKIGRSNATRATRYSRRLSSLRERIVLSEDV